MVCSGLWKLVCRLAPKGRYSDIPILNGRGVSFDKASIKPLGKSRSRAWSFLLPTTTMPI